MEEPIMLVLASSASLLCTAVCSHSAWTSQSVFISFGTKNANTQRRGPNLTESLALMVKVLTHTPHTQHPDHDICLKLCIASFVFRSSDLSLKMVFHYEAGLPLGPALFASNPSLCFMALLGGLMYTGGIIFFVRGNMEFHLAIWHGFVLLASVCFYLLIALFIVGTFS